MADPTLTRFSADLRYTASDGYRMEAGFSSKDSTPKAAILEALDELARIAALFGHGEEAQTTCAAAVARVESWRARRVATPDGGQHG